MYTRLKQLIAEIKEDPQLASQWSDETDIINDIGLDSLQVVTLLFKLEEVFDVEIDFDNFDYADLSAIGRLADKLGIPDD
jgi:acyl carrier protein